MKKILNAKKWNVDRDRKEKNDNIACCAGKQIDAVPW